MSWVDYEIVEGLRVGMVVIGVLVAVVFALIAWRLARQHK